MPLSGLPVLPLLSSCLRASANTPAETDQCACRSLPDLSSAFPRISNGSASALPVSRLAQHSLAFRPASSPSRPGRPFYPECFKPCRYLHDPPWLLPTGATVVGQVSHLPEKSTFPRRTRYAGYVSIAANDRGTDPLSMLQAWKTISTLDRALNPV